jgi:hypothetical protein
MNIEEIQKSLDEIELNFDKKRVEVYWGFDNLWGKSSKTIATPYIELSIDKVPNFELDCGKVLKGYTTYFIYIGFLCFRLYLNVDVNNN